MSKKLIIALTLFLLNFSSVFAFSFADENVELAAQESEAPISAVISAPDNVGVNRNIIFDASATVNNTNLDLSYEWILGDGNRQFGEEIVHSYAKAGQYEVTLNVSDGSSLSSSALHSVFVYERSLVLISDIEGEQDKVESFVDSANMENVFVKTLVDYGNESEFVSEENLQNLIVENIASIKSVDTVVIWTESTSGLTALSRLKQDFEGKTIIFISDLSFGSLRNIARGVFNVTNPEQVVLSRPESIWVLLETETTEEFLSVLESRSIQAETINDQLKIRIWNFMSYLVNSMLERGVPSSTISLVLMLPVIVTIVAAMKQVVGFSSLGVYIPSILALSFIALDLPFGLSILFTILVSGMLTRLLMKRYRLLYIPRMAIVLTIVSLTIFMILFLASYLDISRIVGIAVFPMLIMSTLVEKFVTLQSDKGFRAAAFTILETILVAVLCYYIAEWPWLKTFVLGHPEVLFLFLIANIFLGRWTGLRVVEFIRFREIIRHVEEE